MTCIKTGARVHFVEMGCIAPADLYRVENCIVIRTPGALDNCAMYEHELEGHGQSLKDRPVTHTVTEGFNSFWRPDLGIFVVPINHVSEVLKDG